MKGNKAIKVIPEGVGDYTFERLGELISKYSDNGVEVEQTNCECFGNIYIMKHEKRNLTIYLRNPEFENIGSIKTRKVKPSKLEDYINKALDYEKE